MTSQDMFAQVKVLGPQTDGELKQFCATSGLELIQPSVSPYDLVARYFHAAVTQNATHVIRITSDCWAMRHEQIVACMKALRGADYVTNTIRRTFPEGFDCQGATARALSWVNRNQMISREHPFIELEQNRIMRDKFRGSNYKISLVEWAESPTRCHTSIDTEHDLKVARQAVDELTEAKAGLVSRYLAHDWTFAVEGGWQD